MMGAAYAAMGAGHAAMAEGQDVMGYGIRRDGRANHHIMSRRTHVIPASITSFPRRRESGRAVLRRPLMCACLRRLPRRPGAEERGARGDEQAAGKEEQEQQAAGDAGAASSGELVRRNGRRSGRGRRRGHRRAGWRHRWRGCGRGRPGCYDVIRSRHGERCCARRWSASRRRRCLRCPRDSHRKPRWGWSSSRHEPRWGRSSSRWHGCPRRRSASRLSPGWPRRWWRPGARARSGRHGGRRGRRRW